MPADSRYFYDIRFYFYRLAEQLHGRRPFQKRPSERSPRLITDENNRAFPAPQIMFQMVADPSRLAHPRSRYDHFRPHVKIYRLTVITRDRQLQPRKSDRVDAFSHEFLRLLVKTPLYILSKNIRSPYRQRTIHIYFKFRIRLHKSLFFDLADKIEKFLCPSYRESRNHHISTLFKCPADDLCDLTGIIRRFPVQPVSICRLHHDVIRFFRVDRIPQDRFIPISEITRKYDRTRFLTLYGKYLDRRGTEKMPDIRKPNRYLLAQPDLSAVFARNQKINRPERIFHRIERHVNLSAGTLCFPVPPLCLELLDMGTIPQHDGAQVSGRPRRIHFTTESPGIKHR